MAAGKSTVCEALAQHFKRSVHLRGDIFRKMIVNGEADMGPVLTPEARAQLTLRHEIACDAVRRYCEADFAVVYQDVLVGPDLELVVARLTDLDPRVVVLVPDAQTLAERDSGRAKTGYGSDFPPSVLVNAFAHETPRMGLWIDSSKMTVGDVVERILAEYGESQAGLDPDFARRCGQSSLLASDSGQERLS
jgi:hypothetical protein